MDEEKNDNWIFGCICAALGGYVILTAKNFNDVAGGLFLIGLGIAFMSATSKEFRRKVFNFFFSIYEKSWKSFKK